MRSGGWLSDWKGLVFAGVMLIVMAASAWAGTQIEMDSFIEGVLGTLFSLALGLFVGYLFIDGFADYLAERQWQRTRLLTLQAIGTHICEVAVHLSSRFAVQDGFRVQEGRDVPNPETPNHFLKLVDELKRRSSSPETDKTVREYAVYFWEDAAWRLDQIQLVLTPMVIQSSRNQTLIAVLAEFESARGRLQSAIKAPPWVEPHSVMPELIGLMEVSGRLYGVVAEEWGKCLPKDRAVDRHPHGS